jgi:branched-subunit amino acid transport protein
MTLLMIAGMALATYLTRVPPLMLMRGELPAWLRRWLQFVPIAVFTGLVIPPIVAPRGTPELGASLLAGLAGALVAWRTKQIFATIGAGLLVFALSRFL